MAPRVVDRGTAVVDRLTRSNIKTSTENDRWPLATADRLSAFQKNLNLRCLIKSENLIKRLSDITIIRLVSF